MQRHQGGAETSPRADAAGQCRRTPSRAGFTEGPTTTPLVPHAVFSMAQQTPMHRQPQPSTPTAAQMMQVSDLSRHTGMHDFWRQLTPEQVEVTRQSPRWLAGRAIEAVLSAGRQEQTSAAHEIVGSQPAVSFVRRQPHSRLRRDGSPAARLWRTSG